jgi:hypothetical protein
VPDDGEVASGEELAADLTLLLGDARHAEATGERIRERSLRAVASAEATLVGILLDLAEHQDELSLRTTSGRTLQGRIVVVARDAVILRSGSGLCTYVRLGGLAWVRRLPSDRQGRPRDGEPAGDRPAPRDTTFAALVADLAGDRPRVALGVIGEQTPMTGELRAMGADVLTIRLDGEPPATAYVAAGQLSELTVLASG